MLCCHQLFSKFKGQEREVCKVRLACKVRMCQRAATYLIPLQRGAHQDHRSHGRDHIIRRGMLCLQREETPSDG